MDYFVVVHTNRENNSDVSIVDDDMLPACFFLSNHMCSSFADLSFNTRLTYAKVLLFVFRYFAVKSIDLPVRVESGEFLTREEYDEFKRYCKYKEEAEIEDQKVVSFARFSDKRLDNLIYATQSTESKVSANTVKMRLRQFIDYISYLYNIFHFANNTPAVVRQNYVDFERLLKSDIQNIRNENADVKDPFEKSIPDDIFLKLLEIIKPFSPDNPWTESSRTRNKLIVDIFIETGIRLGALNKLKISDIKEGAEGTRLHITRTPNDPTDPRKLSPAQKTKAHSSSITTDTRRTLKLYIETERSKYAKANTHDFVFVGTKGNNKGLPITNDRVYKIIKTLSDAVNFPLHPHLFRHKWNEIFDEKATSAGYSPAQLEDLRKYAMGWVENSKMSTVYNNFRHAMKVYELSAQRQNDTVPSQQENSNANNE